MCVGVPIAPPPTTPHPPWPRTTSPISYVHLETQSSPKGARLASWPGPGWRVLTGHVWLPDGLLGQLPGPPNCSSSPVWPWASTWAPALEGGMPLPSPPDPSPSQELPAFLPACSPSPSVG